VVGDVARQIAAGARSVAGWLGVTTEVATPAETLSIAAGANPDDVVLVKASNSIGLWSVAEALLAESANEVGA
jgi:UDP-N-acetylmuramoyl-tripeptide--D-alanyl-D-alanine ligase